MHVWLLARSPALGLTAKLLDMIRSLSLVPACPRTYQQAGLRSEHQICWPFDSRSVAMTTMLLPPPPPPHPHAENGRRLHTHQCPASAALNPLVLAPSTAHPHPQPFI